MKNLIDFRSGSVSPASVGGYSEDQCGDWVQGAGADSAACGCKQELKQVEKTAEQDYYDYDNNDDLELRSATLDLRKKRKTGE